MQRFYTAIIETAKNGFGVFFPDLPGCTSFGKTVEDAGEGGIAHLRRMARGGGNDQD